MMRSLFSGVTGLKTHQVKMDVIGNNIANVNTVGYKASRATFQELFSQTIKGASAASETTGRGGVNAQQVGLGVSLGTVDILFTKGSIERTDGQFDMAIDGDGMFVVKADTGAFMFTRAGNFGVDADGNLVTADGLKVYGWMERMPDSKVEFDIEKELVPINIYSDSFNGNKKLLAASQTTKAELSGNLNKDYKPISLTEDPATPGSYLTALTPGNLTATDFNDLKQTSVNIFSSPFIAYDKLGSDYNISVSFVKNQVLPNDNTEWVWYAVEQQDKVAMDNFAVNESYGINGNPSDPRFKGPELDPASVTPAQGTIVFDTNGKIVSVTPSSVYNSSNVFGVDFELKLGQNNTDISEDKQNAGTNDVQIAVDFGKLTMFSADSSVKSGVVDGYASGEFVTCNVGQDGKITAIYTNGEQQAVGQVALALFANPAGLQRMGSNYFVPTANSGTFNGKGLVAGSGQLGNIAPGSLEMSNVDLSSEFTQMITTQRGFQSNSRIITTSDEMLQELVNLKR